MINYENTNQASNMNTTIGSTDYSKEIEQLKKTVLDQGQRIIDLEREVKRLKNELRSAVSSFNRIQSNIRGQRYV